MMPSPDEVDAALARAEAMLTEPGSDYGYGAAHNALALLVQAVKALRKEFASPAKCYRKPRCDGHQAIAAFVAAFPPGEEAHDAT